MEERTKTILFRRAGVLVLASALCLALGACGRKGPLEPHPADPNRSKAKTGEGSGSQKLSPGNSRKTLSSPIIPPDRPFVMDALL
ncbi:MAG: lipoprotein [Beijerinckiaceae bacterium]|nr:lipoprotein [Beijerinckiaceae bacterium]